jgi:hypothetical protein
MNVIKYTAKRYKTKIAFCCVDYTHSIKSAWVKELTKNIADYTISNVYGKRYNVFVGLDEDELLKYVTDLGYNYAVVFATGTEFINAKEFFKAVENITSTDFFIAGHILDRGEAYYELHHQCYIVNLETYKELDYPFIGKQDLGCRHTQIEPARSTYNIHDGYTPTWVKTGWKERHYNHKCHGWNIISIALSKEYNVQVFDDAIRNNKRYYYPESLKDFNKQLGWSYSRKNYCETELVNKEHTDLFTVPDLDFEYVITTASGTWYVDYISKDKPVTVLVYDYNQAALDYWKTHEPALRNVTFKYLKIDLLGQSNINDLLPQTDCKTILNLSNIFCYEGNSMFASLDYRLYQENQLLDEVPPNYYVLFSGRSYIGFADEINYGQQLRKTNINELTKPTWHMNSDWTS